MAFFFPMEGVQILSGMIKCSLGLCMEKFLVYNVRTYKKKWGNESMGRMSRTSGKNAWALFLLLLAGVVLGGFIGYLAKDITMLSWLNYGQKFGLSEPFVFNLGILVLTFGINIKITMASIIGVIISLIVYKVL